jgi:hypothetical protein
VLALRIVEHLDVVEHVLPCLFACSVGPSPDSLALEEIEEALCHSVVVAVAATAHRVLKIVVLQERRPFHAGELRALIRVDQDLALRLSTPYRAVRSHRRLRGRGWDSDFNAASEVHDSLVSGPELGKGCQHSNSTV